MSQLDSSRRAATFLLKRAYRVGETCDHSVCEVPVAPTRARTLPADMRTNGSHRVHHSVMGSNCLFGTAH